MGTLPIFMVPIADLNIAVSIFRVKSLKYSWLGSNGFLMIHFSACLFIFYWHLLCDDADANILIHHFKRYFNSMPQLSNYNNLLPIKVKILMYLFYPWALLPLSTSLVLERKGGLSLVTLLRFLSKDHFLIRCFISSGHIVLGQDLNFTSDTWLPLQSFWSILPWPLFVKTWDLVATLLLKSG